MKNSLFSKLLGTYVLVTLLSIGVISLLFYAFFSNYYFDVKEKQLLSQGEEMAKVLSPYMEDNDLSLSNEIVNVFNKANISRIWVVNNYGDIVSGFEGLKKTDDRCPEDVQLQKALKGEIVTNRGNISHVEEPVLSVALPVYVDNKIKGAVFVCNPLSDITASIFQTLKIVIWAGIIAISIVVFVSFYISRSITKPIKEITEISLEMTKGNFNQKVKVFSSDEIGKLAETFNFMMVTLDRSLRDLEDEKNKMAEMERIQREFVANASHELRTPLTSIRGYLEAILDGVIRGKDQERKHLRIILKETLRLHRLVNSLLDLSRMESGQVKTNIKDLNISEIIERTVTKLEPLIEDHQLDLEVDISKNLPIVPGDEDLIEQVLINYITNAIRFTPAGGKITVKAEKCDNEARVHVIDTGIGIPPQELPKVWKRFYKINESRPLSKEGAGLGLALVKEIMGLLGGEAWAESEPGQSTVFSFSLVVNRY